MEVSEALVDYLRDITHLNKRTQAAYRERLTVFAQWATTQNVPLEAVNNRKVQAFLVWLR